MERNKIKFEVPENNSDEFFDAVDSFESSSEKVVNSKTPTLKEFSPISKFYSSESGLKTSDFGSASLLSSRQVLRRKTSKVWKVKESLKRKNKDYYEFYNLSLIQEFRVTQASVGLIEFSPDGRFLAVAGESPQIFLYEICRQTYVDEEQFFLYDEPLKVYSAHASQVSSISWLTSGLFFVSGSLDGMVYKWSIAENTPISIFKHNLEVIFLSTHPQNEDLLVTGCKDNRIRIWNCLTGRVDTDFSVQGEITAGKFSPQGLVILGLCTGFCHILSYNCFSKAMEMVRILDCRNKRGPKSSGRKITGFDFVGSLCLITSNDSRIRLFDLNSYEIVQKYKGLKNDSSKIVAAVGGGGKFVVSGSENGSVYIWNLKNIIVPKFNPIFTKKKRYKNSSYEYMVLDKKKSCTVAKFAPDNLVENAQRRYAATKQNVDIHSILVVINKGVLYVFYNKILQAKRNLSLNKSFA